MMAIIKLLPIYFLIISVISNNGILKKALPKANSTLDTFTFLNMTQINNRKQRTSSTIDEFSLNINESNIKEIISKMIYDIYQLNDEVVKLRNSLEELKQMQIDHHNFHHQYHNHQHHHKETVVGRESLPSSTNYHYHYHYYDAHTSSMNHNHLVTMMKSSFAPLANKQQYQQKIIDPTMTFVRRLTPPNKLYSIFIDNNQKIDSNQYENRSENAFSGTNDLTNDHYWNSSSINIEEKNPETKSSNESIMLPINVSDALVATCHMRPNRHIALLNQQDIQGEIQLWQAINSTTEPPILHMKIRLSGFKVDCPDSDVTNYSRLHNVTSDLMKSIETSNKNINKTLMDPYILIPVEQQTNFSKAFGMHIHDGSDMTYDCQSVGNHYNPFNMTHGGPNDIIKHMGDLGNVYSNPSGIVHMDLEYKDLSLTGNYSILNRTIVIHNGYDDYGTKSNPTSKTTGNSGVRIACCVIRESK